MTGLFSKRGSELLQASRWWSVNMCSVNSCKCLLFKNMKQGGEFEKDLQRKAKQVSPKQQQTAWSESKDHREANYVGAETLELWECNIGKRANWDPIASGEMLFCWCREWGKHRPIYWGKIVLWWKKKRPKSRPGLFFTVQSNLSSWRRWVKTNIVLLSAALTEHTAPVKELIPLPSLPQTQWRRWLN